VILEIDQGEARIAGRELVALLIGVDELPLDHPVDVRRELARLSLELP
jgi:hypothetical protein